MALRRDVLGRVRSANDQDVLARKLAGVPEVVRMQDPALERLKPREVRHVRSREVPALLGHESGPRLGTSIFRFRRTFFKVSGF